MNPDLQAAYVDFVSARGRHLGRIAYAVTGNHHRAEDLLQTALVKLYRAWPRVQRSGTEEAYARQIIVRSAIDESRRGWFRKERVDSDVAHSDRAEAPAGASVEDRDALFTALLSLPEQQRKVVLLRHWLGLSVAQTAEELRISGGTVKSHASRGLASLRAVLEESAVWEDAGSADHVSRTPISQQEGGEPLVFDRPGRA